MIKLNKKGFFQGSSPQDNMVFQVLTLGETCDQHLGH